MLDQILALNLAVVAEDEESVSGSQSNKKTRKTKSENRSPEED